MNLIDTSWQLYVETVIPDDAGTVQLLESKRAFYAGAATVMTAINKLSDDSVTEEQGAKLLTGITNEISDFADEQGKL